jgi:hypothetical protein
MLLFKAMMFLATFFGAIEQKANQGEYVSGCFTDEFVSRRDHSRQEIDAAERHMKTCDACHKMVVAVANNRYDEFETELAQSF